MNDNYNNMGSTLEDGIAGRYDFRIREIIKEAWHKTKGSKGTYWKAIGLVCLTNIAITVATLVIASIIGIIMDLLGADKTIISATTGTVSIISVFITPFVIIPLMAGIFMIGVRRAIDEPSQAKSIFNYYAYWRRLWVIPCLILLITLLDAGIRAIMHNSGQDQSFFDFSESIIFLVVFLYVVVSYLLYSPLIVEKQLTIGAAMSASRKGIGHHWWKTFGLLFVIALIIIISAIPLGLGLIWTLPMTNNALGILYRRIYGVRRIAPINS